MPLYTDREKLRQIILNLLGNAVKFTDRGEIKISACQENGNFKLAVADTGIGIEKIDMDKNLRRIRPRPIDQRQRLSRHRFGARYRETAGRCFGWFDRSRKRTWEKVRHLP